MPPLPCPTPVPLTSIRRPPPSSPQKSARLKPSVLRTLPERCRCVKMCSSSRSASVVRTLCFSPKVQQLSDSGYSGSREKFQPAAFQGQKRSVWIKNTWEGGGVTIRPTENQYPSPSLPTLPPSHHPLPPPHHPIPPCVDTITVICEQNLLEELWAHS